MRTPAPRRAEPAIPPITSENPARDALNPTVETLAMLSPTTLMACDADNYLFQSSSRWATKTEIGKSRGVAAEDRNGIWRTSQAGSQRANLAAAPGTAASRRARAVPGDRHRTGIRRADDRHRRAA